MPKILIKVSLNKNIQHLLEILKILKNTNCAQGLIQRSRGWLLKEVGSNPGGKGGKKVEESYSRVGVVRLAWFNFSKYQSLPY